MLPYLSTANTARDLDLLRAAVGDEKLSAIGASHGTHIGAAYVSLFPNRLRALVASNALDPELWTNSPRQAFREQAAGFERSLDRFFAACAANPTGCGFGGTRPEHAFRALVQRSNAQPLPAAAAQRPQPVSGDDVLKLAANALSFRSRWPGLAAALRQADSGDGSAARDLLDSLSGRSPGGSWKPRGEFFATVAQDWRYPRSVKSYLREGRQAYRCFPHFWWLTLSYYNSDEGPGVPGPALAKYPLPQRDVFRGPFRNRSAPPVLVIAGTNDPNTPYAWGQRYTRQLGNARLLTYESDGHGGLTDFNTCLLQAAVRYVNDGTLPARGAVCTQEGEPFPSGAAAPEQRFPEGMPTRRAR